MSTVNLGILAHVDAGKTSLTERLLHGAGVIDEIGSVDAGSTRTDTLALERRRGITIRSAVVAFALDGRTVDLLDTPGHPDFIAEVERVLHVLDGAVLVVSAVEGVQAQTRVLMRTLRRLRVPTLVFVNKTDRRGADPEAVLRSMAGKLAPGIVPMGEVRGAGTRETAYVPYGARDAAARTALLELLAERDEELLAAYVEGAPVPYRRLRAALAGQTARGLVHPVFLGSAITGAGVPELAAGVRELLPPAGGSAAGPGVGAVFKIERGPAGEKIAYVRMRTGTLRTRERVRMLRAGTLAGEAKVTAVRVFEDGGPVPRDAVYAGRIGTLRGLDAVRIGDVVAGAGAGAAVDGGGGAGPGEGAGAEADAGPYGDGAVRFAPPTLESVVVPCRAADRGRLHTALTRLAEQDPLIGLRHDGQRGETHVSLYGEVQKEVVQATLAEDFGVAADFHASRTICRERPAGTGTAAEVLKQGTNPFLATVGLRIDPAPVDSGVAFRLEIELGALPGAFVTAVEETVRETLAQGLHGWRVTDCVVTLTRSGYLARQSHMHGTFDKSMSSTAGDFRDLTPLVLMAALRRAGTRVCEPVHTFRLEVPADTLGAVLALLATLRAVPRVPGTGGPVTVLEGDIPAASVHELGQRVPGLTRGEGLLESWFGRYAPVRGTPPARARTDHDPLDREGYLLRVVRRVRGGSAGGSGAAGGGAGGAAGGVAPSEVNS